MTVDPTRLDLPVGEAMFSQRSIRRFRADRIPMEDLQLIMEAAVKAPSGGNRQPARFLILDDPDVIREFGALYREAWWAKRRDEKRTWTRREEIPPEDRGSTSAARLADEIKDAPCIVLALTTGGGQASSVIPSVQNLMLAARARASARCRRRYMRRCSRVSMRCWASHPRWNFTCASRWATHAAILARRSGGRPPK